SRLGGSSFNLFRVGVHSGRVFNTIEHPPESERVYGARIRGLSQKGASTCPLDAAHGSDCGWVGWCSALNPAGAGKLPPLLLFFGNTRSPSPLTFTDSSSPLSPCNLSMPVTVPVTTTLSPLFGLNMLTNSAC